MRPFGCLFPQCLAAENLFLRKQLALFQERRHYQGRPIMSDLHRIAARDLTNPDVRLASPIRNEGEEFSIG